MTDGEKIEELQQIVATQARLLAEILGRLRDWIPENREVKMSDSDGEILLGHCLGDLPPEMQNKWFGDLLGYFGQRRPLHDKP